MAEKDALHEKFRVERGELKRKRQMDEEEIDQIYKQALQKLRQDYEQKELTQTQSEGMRIKMADEILADLEAQKKKMAELTKQLEQLTNNGDGIQG